MTRPTSLRVVTDPGDPVERVDPEVEALETRSHQGSGEIVIWCPKCKENAVPMRNGTCGFCETQLVEATSEVVTASATPTSTPATDTPEVLVVEGSATIPVKDAPMLELGPGFFVPVDAATQSLGILAVKGAGKSNAAAVLAEEFYDLGIPWVVVDPKGDWWGIAHNELNPDGLPIMVMGGIERPGQKHVPLDCFMGRRVAGMIVEHNLTCVLDISHMDDEDRSDFLADLAEELFELHLHSPMARHIIIEEAHEVIPQTGGVKKTIKAWTRVVTQGRQRGLGITLVSQRSALVHKNVLTQTGSLFVMRTTSPQDRKVVKEWTDFHETSGELVGSLPSLESGEAWIVAPHWLGCIKRIKFRRRWTHDSGGTPEVVLQRSRVLTSDDLAALGEQLSGKVKAAAGTRPSIDQLKAAATESSDVPTLSGSRSAEDIVLTLVGQRPRKRSELMEATGLSVHKVWTLLGRLRDEGRIHKVGEKGGSRYSAGSGPVENERERPVVEMLDELPSADVIKTAQSTVGELSRNAHQAVTLLEELDREVEASGLAQALLRGRYMKVLLERIEAGDMSPELLDRFERIAGLDVE